MIWASRVCLVGAVVCAGLAVWDYFRPEPGPDPAWAVTPAVHELGALPVGEHVVAFELTNPAARPRRIVGLNEG